MSDNDILDDMPSSYEDKLNQGVIDNDIDTVRQMLLLGVDVSAMKVSPICYACFNNNIEMIELLIKYGANPSENNNYGIQTAARAGHIDVIKYLINLGVDVSSNDNYCIVLAEDSKKYEIVKYLKTLPDVILSSVELNQDFHNDESIDSAINTLMIDFDNKSDTDKYNIILNIKKLITYLKDNAHNGINNDSI